MTDNTQQHVSINAQYVKDFSFENPNSPKSLVMSGKESPQVSVSVNLGVERLPEDGVFEVALTIEAGAKTDEGVLFNVELVYAGVFSLINIPEEEISQILGIYCPSMLFPFARRIIADATQSGGFQALMLDPIDFAAMYHQQMQEAAKQEPQTSTKQDK